MRPALLLLSLLSISSFASEMVTIPAGPFSMGCSPGDKQCERDESPTVRVTLPAFQIDTKEVTVTEYRACIDSGKCQLPKTHTRNKYCNFGAPGREQHPVNCIDWADAQQYCAVQGKRLPREAEWEKAARAGSNTPYAFGASSNCTLAISNDGKTKGSAKDELDGCGEDHTWPVASRQPNAWGVFDMHGNAGEWVANFYAPDALAQYAKGKLDYPAQSKQRVVRGGSWDEKTSNLRSSFRNTKLPVSGDTVYGSIGFRCAKDGVK